MNVVLLTGSELRHEFFRKFIAHDNHINVLASYCESSKGSLRQLVSEENVNNFRSQHLDARDKTEIDFFQLFCDKITDQSNPIFIQKGEINDDCHVKSIIELNPDLIIAYGCSIIKSELLYRFERRFINIHLGLSPYYRGSGTNFWPFVNKELHFIGTTFMYIDAGVDTGEIIHQIRAEIIFNDTIHQIGNRLIKDSFITCVELVKNFTAIQPMPPLAFDKTNERYYRKKDFTEDALIMAYNNLKQGLIDDFLENKNTLYDRYPIISNPFFDAI
jgi:phosphoribosylglycinamide formyltransferase-1